MNKSLMFTILLMSILLVSCSQKISNEELKSKIISAQNNLNSYKQLLTINMKMSTEVLKMKVNITSTMNYHSQVDRLAKKMVMKGMINTAMGKYKQQMDMDAYIIGDYMYTNVLGSWMKAKSDRDIWVQQDYTQQIDAMIQSGNVNFVREEKLDGKEYYIVEMKPDPKKIVELFLKQQSSGISLENVSNIGDAVKEYSATLWINKQTYVIEKSQVLLKMEISSNSSKTNSDPTRLYIDSKTDMKLYDINLPVTVTLPDDAKNAQEINASAKNRKNTLTGSVIADVVA